MLLLRRRQCPQKLCMRGMGSSLSMFVFSLAQVLILAPIDACALLRWRDPLLRKPSQMIQRATSSCGAQFQYISMASARFFLDSFKIQAWKLENEEVKGDNIFS